MNWTIHYRGVSWRYSIQFAIDQRVDTGSPGRTERATEAAGAGGAVGGAGAATPQGKPGGGRGGGGGGEATRRRSSLDQLLFVSIFFYSFFFHFATFYLFARVVASVDVLISSLHRLPTSSSFRSIHHCNSRFSLARHEAIRYAVSTGSCYRNSNVSFTFFSFYPVSLISHPIARPVVSLCPFLNDSLINLLLLS